MLEAGGCALCARDVGGLHGLLLCMLEVMRCALLCILEGVEGGIYSLEVLEVLDVLEVPEVMRCVLLCMPECVEFSKSARGVEATRGDALRATLYAGGRWRYWRCRR